MGGVGTVTATVAAAGLVAASALGCTSDDRTEEAFCARLSEVPALEAVVAGSDDTDPAQLDRRLRDAADAYGELLRSAPDDVDDSVSTVVDLVDAVLSTVSEHGANPERVTDELRAVTARHPGVEAASQEVVAYAAEHCDLDLAPPVAPAPTGDG
jgi:hypothetical protein